MDETELMFLGVTANAYIQQQTKGQYPAPIAALEVMIGRPAVISKRLARPKPRASPIYSARRSTARC